MLPIIMIEDFMSYAENYRKVMMRPGMTPEKAKQICNEEERYQSMLKGHQQTDQIAVHIDNGTRLARRDKAILLLRSRGFGGGELTEFEKAKSWKKQEREQKLI